jgi:hypothetical protein
MDLILAPRRPSSGPPRRIVLPSVAFAGLSGRWLQPDLPHGVRLFTAHPVGAFGGAKRLRRSAGRYSQRDRIPRCERGAGVQAGDHRPAGRQNHPHQHTEARGHKGLVGGPAAARLTDIYAPLFRHGRGGAGPVQVQRDRSVLDEPKNGVAPRSNLCDGPSSGAEVHGVPNGHHRNESGDRRRGLDLRRRRDGSRDPAEKRRGNDRGARN